MPECKHPTCGDHCRREKKKPKVYQLKRTPLKGPTKPLARGTVKIKKVATKRRKQNEKYSVLREAFLGEHDECEIQAPGVCTFSALVVHHTNGRENERLLIVEDWLASCPECNVWIETSQGTKWAYENGKKKYKHHKQWCV